MKFSWSYFAIKMTSRKLWLAIGGLAVAIMALLNVESDTQVKVTALIGAVSVVIGYLVANGLTDAAQAQMTDSTAPERTAREVMTAAAVTETAIASKSAAATAQPVTAGRAEGDAP